MAMGKDIFTNMPAPDRKIALIRMPDGMQMCYSKYSLGVVLSHSESYPGYDMEVFQRALRAYKEAEAENLNFGPAQRSTSTGFRAYILPYMVLQS